MTKDQLLAIAKRHAEDHQHSPRTHPRPTTWGFDAVGDRGALLEFVTDIAQREFGEPLRSALDEMRPALKKPALPALKRPALPPLRSRAKKR